MNFTKVKMFYICTNFGKVSIRPMFSKIVLAVMATFFSFLSFGQRHEIGLKLGLSSVVGDIGQDNYQLNAPVFSKISSYGVPFHIEAMYRMNFNPYQTLRIDAGYFQVQFDDEYADEAYRNKRRKGNSNNGGNLDVVFEYNFFPVNNEQSSMLSPYIFGGIGGLVTNTPYLRIKDKSQGAAAASPDFEIYETRKGKFIMSIPFGVGIKYKFHYNWAASAEVKFRPTFSDGIDYSTLSRKDVGTVFNNELRKKNPKVYDEVIDKEVEKYMKDRNIGNTNSNDWLNSVMIGLSYSFGRPPCYCD
mgnify:CR=1 FL=1